jgi:hypothetical protein
MSKIRVFADTNVILESFRTGCWRTISNHFAIETVEECVKETQSGDPCDSRYVEVPLADLMAGLVGEHPVSDKEVVTLVLSHPSSSILDDGEKHLFAWLYANKLLPLQSIVVATADKAAIRVANELGWLDCVSSLEILARKAGGSRTHLDALASQYREDWLSSIKTKIRLGVLP